MLASVRPLIALEVRCSGTRFRLSFHGPGGFQVRRARPSPFGHAGREEVQHCAHASANKSESVRGDRKFLAQILWTNREREDSFRKQKEDCLNA